VPEGLRLEGVWDDVRATNISAEELTPDDISSSGVDFSISMDEASCVLAIAFELVDERSATCCDGEGVWSVPEKL
jgi:hypothetical protein